MGKTSKTSVAHLVWDLRNKGATIQKEYVGKPIKDHRRCKGKKINNCDAGGAEHKNFFGLRKR